MTLFILALTATLVVGMGIGGALVAYAKSVPMFDPQPLSSKGIVLPDVNDPRWGTFKAIGSTAKVGQFTSSTSEWLKLDTIAVHVSGVGRGEITVGGMLAGKDVWYAVAVKNAHLARMAQKAIEAESQ